jgi:hypothetical protein
MFQLLEDRSGKDFQRMNTLAYFVTTKKNVLGHLDLVVVVCRQLAADGVGPNESWRRF